MLLNCSSARVKCQVSPGLASDNKGRMSLAPGSPSMAKLTTETIKKTTAELDQAWGLDHGCWVVTSKMFPKADIPVIQLSLDYGKNAQWHYELGKEIAALREKGALILASGNMVHNLRMINWNDFYAKMDWAEEMQWLAW